MTVPKCIIDMMETGTLLRTAFKRTIQAQIGPKLKNNRNLGQNLLVLIKKKRQITPKSVNMIYWANVATYLI